MLPFIFRQIFRLLFGVRVTGSVGRHERLLFVANHTSYLDGALLGAFLPVMPVWLMHTTQASKWYFRLPMKLFPYLVVDTQNPLAIKALINLVESGKPVMIFPEGRISNTGSLMKIYEGPALVAARTGAAVVAVHIDGAFHTKVSNMGGKHFPTRWFARIRLHISEPKRVPMPEARTAKERRRIAADKMRRILQESALEARQVKTIPEALLDAVDLYGRKRALMEDIRGKEETYGQILKASLALGRLASRLTAEGEYVGVLMPTTGVTVELVMGLLMNRRVAAMLNYTSGLDGMQNACRAARVKTVLTSRAFLEKARLQPVIDKLQDVKVVYLEDLRPMFGLADKLWLILRALPSPRGTLRPARPSDPAMVLFTSGSEGVPKGVVLSHDSILANVAQLRASIDFNSRDKFLSVLPLFHAFGLTVGAFAPLLHGARVLLYPTPLHYRVIPELSYDRDCTIAFATNTFLANYAKRAHPYDFNKLRILGCGAEKLTDDVRTIYMEKFGIRITEGYGATELAPVISLNTHLAYRKGTVGELLPAIEHRIEPVPGIDAHGLLHVRGPNLMLGYLKPDRPGEIQPPASSFGPGWYNTGDVVNLDSDGYITLVGRMRRFAKVAGEMVSLELVERIAVQASPNFQHASSSRTETGRGEVIVLFTQDANLKREQLQQAARAMGAPELAIARRIVYCEKLPLLGNGKKDYVTLGRMAQELPQAGRPAEPVAG